MADKHAALLARLKKSIVKVDAAQEDRDKLIVESIDGNVPVPQIASAVGLSRARIYQIKAERQQ